MDCDLDCVQKDEHFKARIFSSAQLEELIYGIPTLKLGVERMCPSEWREFIEMHEARGDLNVFSILFRPIKMCMARNQACLLFLISSLLIAGELGWQSWSWRIAQFRMSSLSQS